MNCRTHEHRHFERTLRVSDHVRNPRLSEGRANCKTLPVACARLTARARVPVCLGASRPGSLARLSLPRERRRGVLPGGGALSRKTMSSARRHALRVMCAVAAAVPPGSLVTARPPSLPSQARTVLIRVLPLTGGLRADRPVLARGSHTAYRTMSPVCRTDIPPRARSSLCAYGACLCSLGDGLRARAVAARPRTRPGGRAGETRERDLGSGGTTRRI